jgi:WD40 repeat protein
MAWVRAINFSQDGQALRFVSECDGLRTWTLATGKDHAGPPMFGPATFSADGRQVVGQGRADNLMRLWDLDTGRERARGPILNRTTFHTAVALSPDGRTAAVAGFDDVIYVCDLATGRLRTSLHGHEAEVFAVAFAPDGQTLASGGKDRLVRLWDVTTGQQQTTLAGHDGAIYALAFAPDGKRLASGGFDKTVRLWPLAPPRPAQ